MLSVAIVMIQRGKLSQIPSAKMWSSLLTGTDFLIPFGKRLKVRYGPLNLFYSKCSSLSKVQRFPASF